MPPTDKGAHSQGLPMQRTIVPVTLLTIVVGGCGGLLGAMLMTKTTSRPAILSGIGNDDEAALPSALSREARQPHDAENGFENGGARTPLLQLKELPPIVTNLASPEKAWIRMQASIVYDTSLVTQPDIMVAQIVSDTVAFLRTETLASIEGAEGLRRLREDLNERASIRSDGHVRELIIETLVTQ